MDSLLSTFNIDLKLLIAQAVNFAVVFAVLYFFALKPLFRIMAERATKIEKSLADAKAVEERLKQTEQDYQKEMGKARAEANAIMAKANELAEAKRQAMLVKAKEEIGAVINEEKARMQQEKAKTLKEIKTEVASLVIAGLEKVLEKKTDSKDDLALIKKAISGK
ncbi:MAG: F0F1 ATP synthase subunit B [Planctomycetes bacterium]|jgi:F-type H+-transporting ATPase subunit b|nr:F0F1 ATP synthase subunit B [Planctomycetota bacterium]